MHFFSQTDKGITRPNNEDNCRGESFGEFTLLSLADGMGGANSGEVASQKAIETVFSYLNEGFIKNLIRVEIPQALLKVMDKANKLLYSMSQSDKEYSGMGTTLDICIASENYVYIAHIGDGRVYKITSSGDITRVTKDHSLVEYMLETGAITPSEAKTHPQKNIITKALGTAPNVEPDILSCTLEKGDYLLMCSDGLTNVVSEEEISKTVISQDSLSSIAKRLIALANNAGGPDNITVIIAQN